MGRSVVVFFLCTVVVASGQYCPDSGHDYAGFKVVPNARQGSLDVYYTSKYGPGATNLCFEVHTDLHAPISVKIVDSSGEEIQTTDVNSTQGLAACKGDYKSFDLYKGACTIQNPLCEPVISSDYKYVFSAPGYEATTMSMVCKGEPSPTPAPELRVRRDIKHLSREEKSMFVDAFHKMKSMTSSFDPSYNAWDYFVEAHLYATSSMSLLIHGGWLFFPWHRELMRRFESEVQRATGNKTLAVTYWDWTDATSYAAMMSRAFLYGDGDPTDGYRVHDGNFACDKWPGNASLNGGQTTGYKCIARSVGNGLRGCLDQKGDQYVLDTIYNTACNESYTLLNMTPLVAGTGPPVNIKVACEDFQQGYTCKQFAAELPSANQTAACFNTFLPYTVPPNNYSVAPDIGWRACLEGMDPSDKYAVAPEGQFGASLTMHGGVHTFIGGTTASPASPNDPIFFMIHGNVDRMWAAYQARNGCTTCLGLGEPDEEKKFLATELPFFKGVTVADTLHPDYTYESLAPTDDW